MNRKYKNIITKESETVKHLYNMISPKTGNFARAKQEIEPYDDLDELRKENLGQRMAQARAQIYKYRQTNE